MRNVGDIFNRVVKLLMLTAAICLVATTLSAQNRNVVFKGVITNQGNGYLIMRTEEGLRHQVMVDENTHIFKDSPEFSIANIDKLVLQRSNLKVGSRVEIVARNTDRGYSAGIITVLSPDPRWRQTVAKK